MPAKNDSASQNPGEPDDRVASMVALYRFPYPWPPPKRHLMIGAEVNGIPFELVGLIDGRIELKTPILTTPFISQPIKIESDRPTWALLTLTLTPTGCSVRISQHPRLLADGHVPRMSPCIKD